MTRRDILSCFHEPFGDAFYFGPEKISPAWLRWEEGKIERTGKSHYTYDYVLQTILETMQKYPNKRAFIKDMSYHVIPPSHSLDATAPSLHHLYRPEDPPNPTLLPSHILQNFQFIFLIRNPSASIPSLYRCFLPPLSDRTGEYYLDPTELGYRELRILLDHLYPPGSRLSNEGALGRKPIVIDAGDFLSQPESIIRSVCSYLGIPYSPSMLSWSTPQDYAHALELFEKFAGYHDDALHSTGLRGMTADREKWGKQAKTREDEDQEWRERYGDEAAREIREAVDLCREDYEYLRQFRLKPEESRDRDISG
ncbi:hypothetical protein ACLMJK_002091 [Lecanora helva]